MFPVTSPEAVPARLGSEFPPQRSLLKGGKTDENGCRRET